MNAPRTKLDQCNSVLVGASGDPLNRLQSVLNAAARLVYSRRSSEHITPLLRDLHWLRVPERIQFRLCVSGVPLCAWHCVCMAQHRRICQTVCGRRQRSSLVVVSALLTPRRCRCRRHADLLWAIARFPWLEHGLGTVCLHSRDDNGSHFLTRDPRDPSVN